MGDPHTYVIIGGASGIGRAVCSLAHRSGHRVFAVDIRVGQDEPWEIAELDVRDAAAITEYFTALKNRGVRIDALVITAGIVSPEPVPEIAHETAAAILETNALAPITLVAASHDMLKDASSIVLFSSVAASRGGGFLGASVYAASKAAIEGLTRGLAREFSSRGIRVNCIAPGPTHTPILDAASSDVLDRLAGATFLGRLAEPEEVANVVLFLCSPEASFITGEVVGVDGGSRIK